METTKLQSAKIIAFPMARRRAKINAEMLAAVDESAKSLSYEPVDFGGCWYHDEALAKPPTFDKK